LTDDSELWPRLDARRETCTARNARIFQNVCDGNAPKRAAEADLIIVNHYLFFADLALKQDDFGTI